MVTYPNGTWCHYESEADVEASLGSHVMRGRRVERRMSERKGVRT